jgi:hypothetical protein
MRLQAAGSLLPDAHASVAVNSLGMLDLVEIAAAGLAAKSQYQVYLSESDHAPFGKLEPLAVLKTNADGAAIAQAIGPLKSVAASAVAAAADRPRRYLVVTAMGDPSQGALCAATCGNRTCRSLRPRRSKLCTCWIVSISRCI